MQNYITRGFGAQKRVGKQRVGKQTSGQNIKGENRSDTGAHRRLSPVGCVKAMWRYTTRSASKQKRRLLRFPGNEITLIIIIINYSFSLWTSCTGLVD